MEDGALRIQPLLGVYRSEESALQVRAHVRGQASGRASVAKECWEAHLEAGVEARAQEVPLLLLLTPVQEREVSQEERVEALRRVTEEMLTSRTEYVESTRAMAQRACRVGHSIPFTLH